MLRMIAICCLFFSGLIDVSAEPISGSAFISEETRAMQMDDFANPAMEMVEYGRKLFHRMDEEGHSCADCHGEDGKLINKAHIAQYPRYDKLQARPITLQDQANVCWEEQMDNFPYVYDCKELVAMEAYLKFLARGETINVKSDGPVRPFYEQGEKLYHTRFGQLDMACFHCHDQHQGQRLRAQTLSQGQSNGFPVFRLSTGRITSLHLRFSECMVSFHAEPFPLGSDEYINLELYLATRSNGLKIETPAVRE